MFISIFICQYCNSWIFNDIGRNCLLGIRKKIAKFLMRTFTGRSTSFYGVDIWSVFRFGLYTVVFRTIWILIWVVFDCAQQFFQLHNYLQIPICKDFSSNLFMNILIIGHISNLLGYSTMYILPTNSNSHVRIKSPKKEPLNIVIPFVYPRRSRINCRLCKIFKLTNSSWNGIHQPTTYVMNRVVNMTEFRETNFYGC